MLESTVGWLLWSWWKEIFNNLWFCVSMTRMGPSFLLWAILMTISPPYVSPSVFPSTLSAQYIPNLKLQGTHSFSVEPWKNNSDIIFGDDYGLAKGNILDATGCVCSQMFTFYPTTIEMSLRLRSLNESTNYEDFFFHFAEDTALIVSSQTPQISSSFNGVPWVFGCTVSSDHCGFSV